MHLSASRRVFLQTAPVVAAGLGAVGMGAALHAQTDEDFSRGWIDAHSHIWTRDIKRFPLAKGRTLEDLQPASFTAGELLKTAQPHGVSRVVLIAHNVFYAYDNSYMLAAVRQHPGRFRVVGMIDETAPAPAASMKQLLKQGVTGFRITPRIRGRDKWLAHEGMTAMWKTAAVTRQAMCCLIDAADLPAIDRMCRLHPETPVVIDHFARIGVDGRMHQKDIDNLCRLAKHKHTAVKISAYYALGKKKPPHKELLPMIKQVIAAFGAGRTMWASDAPYQLTGGNNYAASINLIKNEVPDRKTREQLLRDTAARVFFF